MSGCFDRQRAFFTWLAFLIGICWFLVFNQRPIRLRISLSEIWKGCSVNLGVAAESCSSKLEKVNSSTSPLALMKIWKKLTLNWLSYCQCFIHVHSNLCYDTHWRKVAKVESSTSPLDFLLAVQICVIHIHPCPNESQPQQTMKKSKKDGSGQT